MNKSSPTIAKCRGCGFVGPWSAFHLEWECESWEIPQQYQVAYCLFCENGEVEPWDFRISLSERIHNTRLRLARWINPNKQ